MRISNLKILQLAVESIELREDLPEEQKTAAIRQLQAFGQKDWYHRWDKGSILQALQDYKARTGSAPTVTNLKEPGMPKSLTIKNTFHMDASAFLRKLFPELNQMRHCNPTYASPFGFQTKEDWLGCFRTQFQKHRKQITSAKKYNIVKDEKTPTWGTICNHVGVSTWTELMEIANVHYMKRASNAKALTLISASSPYLEMLKEINETREELINRFEELMKRRPAEINPPRNLQRSDQQHPQQFTQPEALPQPLSSKSRALSLQPSEPQVHLVNMTVEE